MVTLRYSLSKEWNEQHGLETDVAQADESDLRYAFYLGDIYFRINGVAFDAPWNWVPILDFAVGLVCLVRNLRTSRAEVFDFTESEAEIRFVMADDVIEVNATYSQASASVEYTEMLAAAEAFGRNVMTAAEKDYPELLLNPYYLSIKNAIVGPWTA